MICKTEAIVLKTLKFKESSLIASLYTLDKGRNDFIIHAARSVSKKNPQVPIQIGSYLEIIYYHKSTRELQTLTQSSPIKLYNELYSSPIKILYATLLAEIAYYALKESESNEAVFQVLKNAYIQLDTQPNGHFLLLIQFLLNLAQLLGFQIQNQSTNPNEPLILDIQNGTISNTTTFQHNSIVHSLLLLIENQSDTISNSHKKPLLDLLFQYYQCHVPNFRIPKSLSVFQTVFQ